MPTPLRRGLRHAGRGSWYLLAAACVLLALLMGGAWQFMRFLESDPQRVAQWMSQRAGNPVAFDGLRAGWTRRGPLLQLDNLRVGQPGQAVEFGDAELLVSQYAGLLPGRALTELRIRGLDLTLERDAAGRWQVRGLPGQDTGGDPLQALESLGELQVVGARLGVRAPELDIDATLERVDLRLQVNGQQLRAGARARLRAGGAPVDAVLDFDRASGDGRAWFHARRSDLAEWAPLLQLAGVRAEAGTGRSQAWVQLRGHRVEALTADVALDDVQLAGTPLQPGQPLAVSRFERVAGLVRWQRSAGGWRVDAPRLRIAPEHGQAQTLDGLLLAGGDIFAVQAGKVDVGPLLAVLALSNRVPVAARQWLLGTRPDAHLEDLELLAARDGPMRVSGRIVDARFAPRGNAPGLRGLGGVLLGDGQGVRLYLDEAAEVQFDWPRGFGVVHSVHLRGDVVGWREGEGWRVGTTALRVQGRDFAADARGGLWWQGDGSRPRIDLAARLDDAPVTVAKGFWVHHMMPGPAVRWLDMALQSGRLRNGYALVSGDLDEWPFIANNGRFEAGGDIVDASLRFQPDWPALQGVAGQVRFVGDGFSVQGTRGALAGVAIDRFRAGIARFAHSGLEVEASGRGDAAQLLALLRDSPLDKEHGQTLSRVAASGPAAVTFKMGLDTHRPHARPDISGQVQLAGARLAESEWSLVFDQVRGSARYDTHGFAAEGLQVQHKGEPGRLSLRVGQHTRSRGNAFEAELDARLDAADLLQRAPMLAWLKPHVQGVSPWTVAVAMPQAEAGQPAAAPSSLQLRSSLQGTRLDLPAPLQKPAGQALATTIDADLPLGQGEVRVAFDDRLALRARESGGQTGVRVVLGQRQVAEAPPRSGLAIAGRTPQLDALDWVGLLRGGERSPGSGAPLALREADIRVGRLNLIGGSFADTRLQLTPVAGATRLQLDGPALAGDVRLPEARHATVTGRLQRLYWQPPAGAASTAARSVAGDASLDPAEIPPLDISVEELRMGRARLGQVQLLTRPVAGGLHVTRLQARGPGTRIDASGQWLGRGLAAHTRMALDVGSSDFGGLLASLGLGGQLQGGQGRLTGDLRWAGGPAQFALGGLQGSAQVAVENGQLIEIEPGAGRVLGLFGLAQLPRRLSLDFRDFFDKGLSFDKLGGDVRFGNGLARTDNLRIESPAADIRIRGNANLAAQTYDQTIEVTPHTGNLLPVAGALAGGPVGAAIGAAANVVLRRPLGQMGARTYRVTGPWTDPQVRTVGAGTSTGGNPRTPAPAPR